MQQNLVHMITHTLLEESQWFHVIQNSFTFIIVVKKSILNILDSNKCVLKSSASTTQNKQFQITLMTADLMTIITTLYRPLQP